MAGTWQGVSNPPLLTKELVIDSINGSGFSGTKTNKVNNRSRAHVTVAVTGSITENNVYFKYGNVLDQKDPAHGKWWTCNNCNMVNKISIQEDSLILSMVIVDCVPQCNGESRYYRLLCDYDSSTQVSLINLWGTANDIAVLSACKEKVPKNLEKKEMAAILAKQEQEEALKPFANISADTALKTRINVLLQTYKITTPDIVIEIFDNAQIDGDRVSIFDNDKLIVRNQMLQKEPIRYTIHADAGNRVHELVMVAENLGKIEPNTAMMRITVGMQQYNLPLRTDLSTNAKIIFDYVGN